MIEEPAYRQYTELPLPSRKYIPGLGIHPDKHPHGSHVPDLPRDEVRFTENSWQRSRRYLYGIDLFNAGFWWEAHEVMEELWIQCGRTTQVARFLQGIIQVSAALLKYSISNPRGARRLKMRAQEKLELHSGVFLGIDVDELVSQVAEFIDGEQILPPRIELSGLEGGH
jgi:hypothetical protein